MPAWILFILVIVFVLAPLANSIAHRIESGASRSRLDPGEFDQDRLEQVEERLALLGDELHELAEKQEFLTRLLEAAPEARAAEPEDETG